MWTCKSCLMENEDKDALCYMCGTKRPHMPVVRQKTAIEPPEPIENDPVQTAEPESSALQTLDGPVASQDAVVSQEPAAPEPDVNLFASVFNTPATQEKPVEPPAVAPVEPPAEPSAPQPAFSEVFNDFLHALEQLESQKEKDSPEANANPAVTPPPPPTETEHEEISRRRAKKQMRAQNRKAVAGQVTSFLRILFIIGLCAWLFSLGIVVFAFFAENAPPDVRYNAEELFYAFLNSWEDLCYFTRPELAEHFLSVIRNL